MLSVSLQFPIKFLQHGLFCFGGLCRMVAIIKDFILQLMHHQPLILTGHGCEFRQTFGDHGGRIMARCGNVKPVDGG